MVSWISWGIKTHSSQLPCNVNSAQQSVIRIDRDLLGRIQCLESLLLYQYIDIVVINSTVGICHYEIRSETFKVQRCSGGTGNAVVFSVE